MHGLLLSGYDAFKSDTSSAWTGLNNAIAYDLPSVYHLLQKFGVYAVGIAFLISCGVLMWVAQNPQKLGEAKDRITRVCIATTGMFGVGGIVALVWSMAL